MFRSYDTGEVLCNKKSDATTYHLPEMKLRSRAKVFWALAFPLLGAAGPQLPTLEEQGKKHLAASRTDRAPTIDGALDDACWDLAVPDDSLRQRYPHDGDDPTQRTIIRVLYDDTAIYVGVRLEDTDPSRIVARLARRDRQIESDSVMIMLDSRHDHATAYGFQLNAAGVQADALYFDDNQISYDWDAVWDGAARRDEGGWTAEFRIPLSVLRFPDVPAQSWGLQVERYISRNQERDRWTWTPQSMSAEVSPMGHLVGLDGLHPRRTLELRPFVVARATTHTRSGGALFGFDPAADVDGTFTGGLDAKVGLTSNLTLDATVNPDFGQVDADQIVLNLSHFETFFPEKRPFFLEGTDLFNTPLGLFYSRRIGRTSVIPDEFTGDDGMDLTTLGPLSSVPIRGALKLSGKVGDKLSVGALEALTGPDEATALDFRHDGRTVRFLPPMSYAVARAKYALRGATFLGAMATAVTRFGDGKDATHDHDAFTQSVDGAWRSADTRWRLGGQAVLSERVGGGRFADEDGLTCDPAFSPGRDCRPLARNDGLKLLPGDVGYGLDLEGAYEGEHWTANAATWILSPKLGLNDMGFWPRYDRYVLNVGWGYRNLKATGSLQKWDMGMGSNWVLSWDGTPEDAEFGFGYTATLTSFWTFHVEAGPNLPGTWDHFETQDGGWFEQRPGMGASFYLDSDARRAVTLHVDGFGGTALGRGGWNVGGSASLKINAIPNLELELAPQLEVSSGRVRNWFQVPCVDDAGRDCSTDTTSRHYRFGELDAGSLSLTTRMAYAFSPTLSLQAYAQLFLDRGRWSHYSTVDTVGLHPFIRYSDLRPDPLFNGDSDGDGIRDDDFQDISLNLNVVLRWEYAPGATMLFVYTRAQKSDLFLGGEMPHLSLRGLASGPTEDVFLMKLAYFLGT